MAAWEALKAEGTGYPVLVGNRDDAEMVAESSEMDGRTVEVILSAAQDYRFPQALFADRDHWAEVDGRSWRGPEMEGPWPDGGAGVFSPGPALAKDSLSRRYLDEAWIVLLPTDDQATAIAMLGYGGWNECPGPEEHVAAFRSWRERFGFELIGAGKDVIEGRVSRRPSSRQEALELAWEQYAYCPDIVDQGVVQVSVLAAGLMESSWWYFWWD